MPIIIGYLFLHVKFVPLDNVVYTVKCMYIEWCSPKVPSMLSIKPIMKPECSLAATSFIHALNTVMILNNSKELDCVLRNSTTVFHDVELYLISI